MKKGGIEVLARGVLVRSGFLLVCRTKGSGMTYLPGGHVEFIEPTREGLRREIREELGVAVKVGAFLGAVEHTFLQKGRRHFEMNLVFRMGSSELNPGLVPRSKEDWISFEWLSVERLGSTDLEPYPLRRVLPRCLRSRVPFWASTIP